MTSPKAADATFDVIAFFKSEVQLDDPSERLNAIKRLDVVAWHAGKKKVVEDIMPFLFDLIKTEPFCRDDEFLYRLAEQCEQVLDYYEEAYDKLIPLLEYLTMQEETVIRAKAVDVIGLICKKCPMGSSLVSEHLVPVLERLTQTQLFTARVSACGMYHSVYPHATDAQKADMRQSYGSLCSDDTPMVRRAAATMMKELVSVVDRQSIMNDIIPIYRQLAQEDTQDSIRVSCVFTTLVLIEHVFSDNPEENKAHTLLVITNAVEDRSWRVRFAVAKSFSHICKHMGSEITATFLLNPFVQLMKDSEQEVRKAAVESVTLCIPYLTVEQLQTFIVPQFQSIGVDSSPLVRSALADVLAPTAKVLGRELTQKLLLNTISDLMKDEYHEVRQNIVSHAAQICSILGMDVLTHSLLNTIQSLMMDNQWRIRQSVIKQIPSLAKQFGPELFQTKLEPLFLSSLNDSVHSVREVAIENVPDICLEFGSAWSVDHMLPKIMDQHASIAGYSNRLTCLNVLPQLCHVMTPELIVQHIVPTVLKATKDTVPNVQFSACIAIRTIIVNYQIPVNVISTLIKPAISELLHNTDIDVQYYASQSLEACDQRVAGEPIAAL